jgi:uncharacterized membrane protein
MNLLYLVFKFLHVAAVIVWVGGLFALVVLNARLARFGDAAALGAFGRLSEFFGRAVVGPAMGLALLAGLATAGSVGYPFSSLWIVWGLGGFVASGAIAGVGVRRTGEALGRLGASAPPDDPRLAALQRRMALLNALNLLLLASIVWAMIFKPAL